MSINYINFYLSGGSNNNNPNLSLGGFPSTYPVALSGINNLFDNVTVEQAKNGNIEYRCFYIFNDSVDQYLYNASAYLIQTDSNASTIEMGIHQANDVHKIQITGQISSGNLKLSYDNEVFQVNWTGDLAEFASGIEYHLNSLPYLNDVLVTATGGGSSRSINITFYGEDGNKNHELIEVVENNLLYGSTPPTITVVKTSEGSPINSIAVQTNYAELAPNNINFYTTDVDEKLNLGKLAPGDGCPIWIKRTIAPNFNDAVEGDGFIFKLVGNPINF